MIDASKLAVLLSSTARAFIHYWGSLLSRCARNVHCVCLRFFFYLVVWIRVSGNQELCDTEVI